MPLRSNFEPGTSRWATRRAQWRALGLTDEDMVKPKIAIVNSSSQLAICFSHLDEIARRARRAVEQAGGVAFEVRTAAPSDFITSAGHRGGYILSARDLITNDIEVAVEGALLDGMLCLASCDKTAPGQLMAAARLNIPSVIVACGYQPGGADVYRLFEKLAGRVPLLAAVRPNGEVPIEAFEDAGGARAVMKQLEPLLDVGALTVTGCTVGQNLAGVAVADEDVIRPPERALGHHPTIVLIRGSLAPDGGIVKLAVANVGGWGGGRGLDFAGPAVVFESPAQALDAVRGGQVSAGQVVVLRGQGPTGSPGMGMASQLVFALDGADLTGRVAVVTDGQLSSLVNKGIVVGEVSPEAARGGPLALVRDGDLIRIDVSARTADLDVPAVELQRRRGALRAPPRTEERGWLSIYQRLVRPLPEGAVLREPAP